VARADDEAAIVVQYRATPRFKQAWKIISPKPQSQRECEYDLVRALLLIPIAAGYYDRIKPAESKRQLLRDARKLRAAIPAVHRNNKLIEDLNREVKFVEDYANSIVVGKGKPRRSMARHNAVHQACELLKKYGSKPPRKSRKGKWHRLAKVLFGDPDADLFDYIERYQPVVG
jgi:hypothetical protein